MDKFDHSLPPKLPTPHQGEEDENDLFYLNDKEDEVVQESDEEDEVVQESDEEVMDNAPLQMIKPPHGKGKVFKVVMKKLGFDSSSGEFGSGSDLRDEFIPELESRNAPELESGDAQASGAGPGDTNSRVNTFGRIVDHRKVGTSNIGSGVSTYARSGVHIGSETHVGSGAHVGSGVPTLVGSGVPTLVGCENSSQSHENIGSKVKVPNTLKL